MNNKVLLFIATEKGFTALKRLTRGKKSNRIGCVVTFKEIGVEKSWDIDIKDECELSNIPFYFWHDVKDILYDVLKLHNITCAVAISWRYLIPVNINTYLQYPLIVFHDSLLPKYRGFAPTPTAIICGETNIGVTAIFANDEIDEGDIIQQKSINIPETMYINEIIGRQAQVSAELLEEIIQKIDLGTIEGHQQNNDAATYSIWRNPDDCHIDWNKSAKDIYNFIRAVGPPYPGAYTLYESKKIILLRSEKISTDLHFCIREPGKIWRIKNNEPEIICGSGLLRITLAIDTDGEVVKFNRLRSRLK